MTATQIALILSDATRNEDRVKMGLCYIALGQATVDHYAGDVRLQIAASIRTHGSAVMALKAENPATNFS